jgi:hypothetical protein
VKHALGIRQHIIVPEADDGIAVRLEPIGACFIVLRVLSAIDLDDEFRRRAEEIDDIGAERMLATEAVAFELLSAQTGPQPELGVRWREPQSPREGYSRAFISDG